MILTMRKLSLILPALFLTLGTQAAPQVKVAAAMDSVAVMQGALRKVDVEVTLPAGVSAQWLTDPRTPEQKVVELAPGIEVNYASKIDTTALGGDRLQLRRTLLIQPWDSGEYLIDGIALVAGGDTFRSNALALKVFPADIDTMTTIHSWMPEATQPRHFWDWVPDWLYNWWWAILLGLLAIAGGIAWYILYRKGGLSKVLAKEPEPVPPYEQAISQLHILHDRQLCEKGREKEYYTELTEILREYLQGRFGINAMEMTTTQIKRAVYATVSEKSASKMMNDILEMADYVKFAKLRPLPEDNERAFRQAMNFVEDTKPEPPAAEDKEGGRK